MTSKLKESLSNQVEQALQRAAALSFDIALPEGYWHGELKSNVTITSEYIFLRQGLGLDLNADRESYRSYLLSEQNEDGSWGLAPGLPGDVSTTSEAYLALKILGESPETTHMRCARDCVRRLGGVAKVRVFTRIFFATFGLFPWSAVPQLPVELMLLPAASPINIYKFASWARSTIIPLLILCHHQPVFALSNGVSAQNDFLDELWLDPSQKSIPYSTSIWNLFWNGSFTETAFTVIDNLLAQLHGLRWVPFLRSYARKAAVQWILEHQEPSGDWAGIFPPMHAGIYALVLEGFSLSSRPVKLGIEALERFAVQDAVGGKRIQPCVSPIWDTALMSIALCDSKLPKGRESGHLIRAINWIKGHQRLGPEGDWRVYRPQLASGGWTFEIHNSWYPDVDDTAAVILALIKQDSRAADSLAVLKAQEWILGMQNEDGGWAAFDVQNNALFLNKIPFSDMDSLCDPSSADVTGRVIEAFGLLVRIRNNSKNYDMGTDLSVQLLRHASSRAIEYLISIQEPSGGWFGRWGSNYVYGTSNVLCGLAYFLGQDKRVPAVVALAIRWLKSVQNEDGGWGESLRTYHTPETAGEGPSTPSQTAWALMALLAHLPRDDDSIERGVRWLLLVQAAEGKHGASWPERIYTGTGFPNHFYLGYTLYRHYFPMMALGRYLQTP